MPITPPAFIWHCSIHDPELNDAESYRSILNKLTGEEQAKINRFMFDADRKRALLSILLQHAIILATFPFALKTRNDYQILRTKENKPYLKANKPAHLTHHYTHQSHSHWNYNVSHHGDYVAIASSCQHLLGVDIVDITTRNAGMINPRNYVEMFRGQLTAKEIQTILNETYSEEEQYTTFFLYWSLKESFIKSIGLGLGYDLSQIEFTLHPSESLEEEKEDEESSATANSSLPATSSLRKHQQRQMKQKVKLSGTATIHFLSSEKQKDDSEAWFFRYFPLDDDIDDQSAHHVMSIAYGPFTAAIPSYQQEVGWSASSSEVAASSTIVKDRNSQSNNNNKKANLMLRWLRPAGKQQQQLQEEVEEVEGAEDPLLNATTSSTRVAKAAVAVVDSCSSSMFVTVQDLLGKCHDLSSSSSTSS